MTGGWKKYKQGAAATFGKICIIPRSYREKIPKIGDFLPTRENKGKAPLSK
jgi:hypothetical protein